MHSLELLSCSKKIKLLASSIYQIQKVDIRVILFSSGSFRDGYPVRLSLRIPDLEIFVCFLSLLLSTCFYCLK